MKYSPTQVMEILGQSKETIRVWSVTFAKFLSPSASPTTKGQHRLYDDSDLAVFFLVKEMRSRGITFDEIVLSLANGERAIIPNAPTAALSIPEQMQDLQITIKDLQTSLDEQRGQNKLLERQIAEHRARAEELAGENAVLKYRLSQATDSE